MEYKEWRESKEFLALLIHLYGKMLVKNPRSFVFLPLADSCIKAGRLKLASEIINRGLSYNPRLRSALLLKARVLLAQGKPESAENIINPIIEKQPDNYLARKLMAETCLKLNKPGEGIKHLEYVRKATGGKYIRKDLLLQLETANKNQEKLVFEANEGKKENLVNTLERWLSNAGKMMIRE